MVIVFFQGGRRYFSRREITALVGGLGNMAVYRHIFGNTAYHQSVTAENEKPPTAKTLPPKNYRHILVLPLPPKKYRQL